MTPPWRSWGGVGVIADGGVMSLSLVAHDPSRSFEVEKSASRVTHDPSAPDYGGTSPRYA